MIWILVIIFLAQIALMVALIETKRDLSNLSSSMDLINEDLKKSISDAHAQVINAEKISRYSLEASNNAYDKIKKMDENNTDIHNVCVLIAKEIQAAKEAQKNV